MIDKIHPFSRPISPWLTRCCIALVVNVCRLTAAQTQVWSEEFNYTSAPDVNVWSYDLGNWGWGNSELQNYTSDSANVTVDGSNLVITARRQGNNFTSARIRTQDKLTFKYGTIEARIQTPDLANGLWPAFWTLGNSFPPWPDSGEIDIMEMGSASAIAAGKVNRRVGSHFHWDHNGSYANYGLSLDRPTDIDGTFVVYRMEWTPTEITTYIDGNWIVTMNTANIPEYNEPHFFILNMAVGGTYTGIFNASGITALASGESAEYKVDWIRIYDNGFTVLGGNPNSPPTFSTDPINLPNGLEESPYFGSITNLATDPNPADTLTYSKVSGPAWLNIATNGALTGTPNNADVGLNSWTVQVSDGNGGADWATLNITVDNVNDDPVFTSDPIIMLNAVEDSGYSSPVVSTLAGSATDVDAGDVLTYSKMSGPTWLNVHSGGLLYGTPRNADVGLNSWTVQVSDGNGGTDTATLEITVDGLEAPPTLTIQVSGSDLEIMWPTSATGFSLYCSSNLIPSAVWSSVTNTPIIQGDDWMVTMPINEALPFFRLQNP